jgi:membrane protease YdiL (CAAX protease family)
MTSHPPPYERPGSLPARPELPDGVDRPPPPTPAADALDTPAWPAWEPFAALLIGVAIAFVGATIVYVAATATGWRGDGQTPAMTIAATAIQDLGFVIGVVGIAAATAGRPSPSQLGLRPVSPLRAIGWVALTYVAFQLFAVVYGEFVHTTQKQEVLNDLGAERSTTYLVLSAILVCVLAPIAEELLFRGFFFAALRRVMPTLAAAALTGLVFGLVHVIGTPFALIAPLAVLGFALCLLYLHTGSLLPCMALHALNNSIAFGVALKWPLAGTVALVIAAPLLVALLGLLAARSIRPRATSAA